MRLKIPILCKVREGRAIRQLHEFPLIPFLFPSCFRLHSLPLLRRSASIISQCSQTTTPGQKLAVSPEARLEEIKARKAPSRPRARTAVVSSSCAFNPACSPSLSPVRRANTIAFLTTRSPVPSSSQKVFGGRREDVRTTMLRQTRITSSSTSGFRFVPIRSFQKLRLPPPHIHPTPLFRPLIASCV